MLNLAEIASTVAVQGRDVGNPVTTAPYQVHIKVDRQRCTKEEKGIKHYRGSSHTMMSVLVILGCVSRRVHG